MEVVNMLPNESYYLHSLLEQIAKIKIASGTPVDDLLRIAHASRPEFRNNISYMMFKEMVSLNYNFDALMRFANSLQMEEGTLARTTIFLTLAKFMVIAYQEREDRGIGEILEVVNANTQNYSLNFYEIATEVEGIVKAMLSVGHSENQLFNFIKGIKDLPHYESDLYVIVNAMVSSGRNLNEILGIASLIKNDTLYVKALRSIATKMTLNKEEADTFLNATQKIRNTEDRDRVIIKLARNQHADEIANILKNVTNKKRTTNVINIFSAMQDAHCSVNDLLRFASSIESTSLRGILLRSFSADMCHNGRSDDALLIANGIPDEKEHDDAILLISLLNAWTDYNKENLLLAVKEIRNNTLRHALTQTISMATLEECKQELLHIRTARAKKTVNGCHYQEVAALQHIVATMLKARQPTDKILSFINEISTEAIGAAYASASQCIADQMVAAGYSTDEILNVISREIQGPATLEKIVTSISVEMIKAGCKVDDLLHLIQAAFRQTLYFDSYPMNQITSQMITQGYSVEDILLITTTGNSCHRAYLLWDLSVQMAKRQDRRPEEMIKLATA
ncbi:MAG: hypothetical protein KGI80_03670 [Verrucomicrobiota bacterium]|nr:hypothetical protein [Verrucomicrobiota bacterium]